MATVEITSGDILQTDVEALVNTVNCVGYMGRGIAAQFKRRFPENFSRGGATRESVVEVVHGWNERKRLMNERQIHLALGRLESQGWLARTQGPSTHDADDA